MPSLLWLKFFVSRWRASKSRMMLKRDERLLYLELIFALHEYGGAIPDDSETLALLANFPREAFDACWPTVRQLFVAHPTEPGMIKNTIALEIITEQAASHELGSRLKAKMPDPQQEWFGEFWTVYMPIRNRSRADAAKALRQVCKSEATFQQIMAALKRQAPSLMDRDQQYRPYGGRWLRSLAWKDDPDESSVGQPARQSATEVALSGLFGSENTNAS